jgi:hypothetical protein
MWGSWVYHSWRFGRAEALREVGLEMPQPRSKTNFNGANRPSNFCYFFVCRDWWPWTNPITMTRRQSNKQWNGSIAVHPVPKIPNAKIRWESSRLDFLGSRRHRPHSLSSKGPNYQGSVLLISAGATEGHFVGKTLREGHQGGLVLARLTGSCRHRLGYFNLC